MWWVDWINWSIWSKGVDWWIYWNIAFIEVDAYSESVELADLSGLNEQFDLIEPRKLSVWSMVFHEVIELIQFTELSEVIDSIQINAVTWVKCIKRIELDWQS